LPTTVSNTTAGFLLGGGRLLQAPGTWVAAVFSVACLYEGGMFLNDWCDVYVDRVERPLRPIPSGRVTRREALAIGLGLFLFGTASCALFFPHALTLTLGLISLIVIYNFVHTRFFLAPLLMGSCRGMVYLLAAVAGGWNFSGWGVWLMAGTLTLYISAVSFIARDEMKENLPTGQPIYLFLIGASLFIPLAVPGQSRIFFDGALAVALLWLIRTGAQLWQKKIPAVAAVGRALAGMSLLDALILARVSAVAGVVISWSCFVGARLWQRRIQSS
jgi:hypothetical protein